MEVAGLLRFTCSHWCERLCMGRTSKVASYQLRRLLKQNTTLSMVALGTSFKAVLDSTSPVTEITKLETIRQVERINAVNGSD